MIRTIYALADPRSGAVRYVGQTSRPLVERVEEHVDRSYHRRTHCSAWIQSLLAAGLEPTFFVLEQAGENWAERECFWIAHFRDQSANLTNHTDGGEGAAGLTHSEEARAKIRAARARQIFTPEQISRMTDHSKGNTYAKGNKRTGAALEQSLRMARMPKSPAHRRKIGEGRARAYAAARQASES